MHRHAKKSNYGSVDLCRVQCTRSLSISHSNLPRLDTSKCLYKHEVTGFLSVSAHLDPFFSSTCPPQEDPLRLKTRQLQTR